MEDKNLVPYIVHEGDMARLERANRRLWILSLVLTLLLIASNAGWLWYESQWEVVETTTQEVSQDIDTGDGDGDTIVTGIGDIYGEGETEG